MKDQEATPPSTYDPSSQGALRAPGPPTRRGVLAVVALVSVGLCAALLVHWMSTPRTRAFAPAGIPVSTGIAKLGDIDIFLDALGTVTPVYTVTVTSRVAGEMTQVSFREGQLVKKNDLLAIIDPRPYEAALLQAQGQLARDQALLKNARIDLSRYQKAYEQHAIPEQQMATQEALVEQYDGVVKLDEGNLAAAQVNVDYTRITSPIGGRVGLRSVDPGNIVQADGTTGLATITQLQPITVIFNIAEDDLSKVTEQVAAGRTLRVDALDRSLQHKLAEGTLLTLDNQINPATGTVRGRATFPNTKDELFPNQFVNARLLIKTLGQVDLVPSAAIQRNDAATFVYVVQADSTVQYRDVKVLATEGESTAVTGVQPGEQLVTDGFDRLQAGTKIAVRAAAAAAAPAAPAH